MVELYGNGVIAITFGADEPGPWKLRLDPPDPDGEDVDDVQLVLGAIDETLNEVGAERSHNGGEARKFDPSQPRDPGGEDGGQWVSSPGGAAAGALKDALKLAGKIDLEPDEKLVGSDKVSGDQGTVRLAAIGIGNKRRLRLGIGNDVFGSRDDDAGPWRAGPDPTAAINAERKKLRDEQDALVAEWDRLKGDPNGDPARKSAVEARLEELDDTETIDLFPHGFTADVDADDLDRFRSVLPSALAKAKKIQAEHADWWDEHDRLKSERDKLRLVLDEHGNPRKWTDEEGARWDALTAQLDAMDASKPDLEYEVFAEGVIPGKWADIHYRVELDDPSVGTQVLLGAVPHDTPDLADLDDMFGAEQGATFDPVEAKKLLRLLDKYTNTGTASRTHARSAWLDPEHVLDNGICTTCT